MKKATSKIENRPDLGVGAQRFVVECKRSETGVTFIPVPGGVNLDRSVLITAAAYAHEERCGRCDTSAVHQEGNQHLRGITEAIWSAAERQAVAARRN